MKAPPRVEECAPTEKPVSRTRGTVLLVRFVRLEQLDDALDSPVPVPGAAFGYPAARADRRAEDFPGFGAALARPVSGLQPFLDSGHEFWIEPRQFVRANRAASLLLTAACLTVLLLSDAD